MIKKYTALPVDPGDPGMKGRTTHWMPILSVRVRGTHDLQTPLIHAVVDSGSPYCLFQSAVADYLHIDITKGQRGSLGGIVSSAQDDVYFLDTKLILEDASCIKVYAGFMKKLRVAAILVDVDFSRTCL